MTKTNHKAVLLVVLSVLVICIVRQQYNDVVPQKAQPAAWATVPLRPSVMTIDYPASWSYRENHLLPVMHWVVSRESLATTAPRVAVDVMAMTKVNQQRNHTVTAEVEQWLDGYQREGKGAVVSVCNADNYTFFQHQCLERNLVRTVAGKPVLMHERTVVLWQVDADALAVVQASAPLDEWPAVQDILLHMQASLKIQQD